MKGVYTDNSSLSKIYILYMNTCDVNLILLLFIISFVVLRHESIFILRDILRQIRMGIRKILHSYPYYWWLFFKKFLCW